MNIIILISIVTWSVSSGILVTLAVCGNLEGYGSLNKPSRDTKWYLEVQKTLRNNQT